MNNSPATSALPLPWQSVRTFKQLESNARACGVRVERTGRKYESWKDSDHSVIGEAYSLSEATLDVRGFAGDLGD